MAGKLGGRGVISAVRPGRLFYVTDSASGRRFLVDTGSAFSIMPWKSRSTPSGPNLAGADGRRIPCWGEKSFTVSLDGVKHSWDFLLAAVSFPILGADFLRHHGLLVDVANLRLLPGPSLAASVVAPVQRADTTCRPSYADVLRSPPPSSPPDQLSSSPSGPSPPSLASPPSSSSDWPGELQARFPAAFGLSTSAPAATPPHGVSHVIRTVGQPATAKFRRLDPARLAAAKAEFQVMLDEGVIRRSSSQWSRSPPTEAASSPPQSGISSRGGWASRRA